LRVVGMTHWPTGVTLANNLMNSVAKEFDRVLLAAHGVFDTKAEAEARAELFGPERQAIEAALEGRLTVQGEGGAARLVLERQDGGQADAETAAAELEASGRGLQARW